MSGALGGLGLTSAVRTSEPAYWAAWVDTFPILAKRLPALAGRALANLTSEDRLTPSLRAAEAIRARLASIGGADIPAWAAAHAGAEAPEQPLLRYDEEGDAMGLDDFGFQRGWQRLASSVLEPIFQERLILHYCGEDQKALLLSQAGSTASAFLRALPSEKAFRMSALRFVTALRRRLRWPIPRAVGICRSRSCRAALDPLGDHAA